MIDGCQSFHSLCRIVRPIAAPGIAATAFSLSWYGGTLFAISFRQRPTSHSVSRLLYMAGIRGAMGPSIGRRNLKKKSTVPVAAVSLTGSAICSTGFTAGAVKG